MKKILVGLLALLSLSTLASTKTCIINLENSDLTTATNRSGYDVDISDQDYFKSQIIDVLYQKGYGFDSSSSVTLTLNNSWHLGRYHKVILTFTESREHGDVTLAELSGKALFGSNRRANSKKLRKAMNRALKRLPDCN